jgi:hypothetical protein
MVVKINKAKKMNTFKIIKEENKFLVVNKSGIIQNSCSNKQEAQDIITAQNRANEQHAVMSAYNQEQESNALMAEFMAEFSNL